MTSDDNRWLAERFEEQRPHLRAVAGARRSRRSGRELRQARRVEALSGLD